MAIPHFSAMLIFSFLTSIVFGVISKDALRDRVFYAAKSFGLFVGIALLIGWITYPFPR
jgi:flagellar biosynthesis protein FliR